MTVVAVVGAQWGDEGKGKVVDVYTTKRSVVARYNGGSNAGHTIYVNGVKMVIHLLPSGILKPETSNLVGPYVACDPVMLVKELAVAKAHGAEVMIDGSAPVALDIHRCLEEARERRAGADAIGSTKQGIGPCYEDLASRYGATMDDYVDPDRFAKYLESQYYHERLASIAHHGGVLPRMEDVRAQANELRALIAPHVGDVRYELHKLMKAGRSVTFEGAQGAMLDIGQRRNCTSSSCGRGAISSSLGVHHFDKVVGVAKIYTTKVGAGPFPTELHDESGEDLRRRGSEFGATTGRPRRCGWLDIPALRFAKRMSGITHIVLNKCDIQEQDAEIQICTDYRLDGRVLLDGESLTNDVLSRVEPIYTTLPGWKRNGCGPEIKPITACDHWEDLSLQLRENIEQIEKWVGIPVIGIGVNAERVVWRKE